MSLYEYTYYCETESEIITEWSATVPTHCKNNPEHILREGSIYISDQDTATLKHFFALNTIARGQAVSLVGENAAAGFGFPTKYVFENKSASFLASCMVGSVCVTAYCSPMSTPTANNGMCFTTSISGGVPSFGSIVRFTSSSGIVSNSIAIVALDSTTFFVVYRSTSNYLNYIFGSVSGTTITCSSPVVIASVSAADQIGSLVALLVGTKIVLAWRDTGVSNRCSVQVGTVTLNGISSTITFNTKTQITSNAIASNQYAITGVTLDSTRFALFYDRATTAIEGIIGTVSGTGASATITTGIACNPIDSANVVIPRDITAITLGTDKVLLLYRRSIDNVSRGIACVLTTTSSGTAAASQAITVNTPYEYTIAAGIQQPVAVMNSVGKIAVFYLNGNNANSCEATVLTISNTTISGGGVGKVFNPNGQFYSIAITGSDDILVYYRDATYFNNGVLTYCKIDGDSVNFYETKGSNIVGFCENDVLTGEVAVVNTDVAPSVFTGLTAGMYYYAHGDGGVTTSPSAVNNSYTSVGIGVAVNSNTITKI